ncbi:MAG: DUF2693 domain-containing protein, partial [Paludibacteraceae bacterium]|nr:DUF2693 domain-containing protein [Paludibacteraceae bacterium]
MISKNSYALHMAHYLYVQPVTYPNLVNSPMLTWSDALKLAWYFVRFKQRLKQGICTFTFVKHDGSVREAKGTLHPLLIPDDKKPKGDMSDGAALPNFKSIAYFDLDKQDWRAFSLENFVGFVT